MHKVDGSIGVEMNVVCMEVGGKVRDLTVEEKSLIFTESFFIVETK